MGDPSSADKDNAARDQSQAALFRIQVDPADKLLSRAKEPPSEGKQGRHSGAEQQKRAATIRHP